MSGPAPNTANAFQSEDAFWSCVGLCAIALLVPLVTYVIFKRYFDFESLTQQEQTFKSFYRSYPIITLTCAFAIYAIVTGLAIPGATPMSLVMSWFFGFTTALVLISFASTIGVLTAFMVISVLGRTKIPARTFWRGSQIGMLPGTAMICFMGAGLPGLRMVSNR